MADTNGAAQKEKEKDVDVVVLNYLKKRGYKYAEQQFVQEANLQGQAAVPLDQLASHAALDHDVSVANYIMFYSAQENDPKRYEESYVKLKEWIHSSLDLYKVCCLYFICFYFYFFVLMISAIIFYVKSYNIKRGKQ